MYIEVVFFPFADKGFHVVRNLACEEHFFSSYGVDKS